MATISNVMEKTSAMVQYDENAKALLVKKPFLSNIIVRTVKEFEGMNPKLVETLIEGEPMVSSVPVEAGFTNQKDADGNTVIVGMNNEDKIPNEGLIFYDAIFFIRTPGGRKKIIINMEAQKDYPTHYHVENRGIFYCARNISAQRDRDFQNQDYDKLQKVYSIWICMNCAENRAYQIHMKKDDIVGEKEIDYDFDLVNVIVVELGKNLVEDSDLQLHRLLGTMFLDFDIEKKLEILETEFDMDIDEDGKERIEQVCNLSIGVLEQGIKQGMEQGIELATMEAIRNMIDLGVPEEQILTKYSKEEFDMAVASDRR